MTLSRRRHRVVENVNVMKKEKKKTEIEMGRRISAINNPRNRIVQNVSGLYCEKHRAILSHVEPEAKKR